MESEKLLLETALLKTSFDLLLEITTKHAAVLDNLLLEMKEISEELISIKKEAAL